MGNKTRVILTSLGIIVGAATIVMVLAIGKGGEADVAEQYKTLNAGAIDITYERASDMGGSSGGGDMGGGGMPGGGMPAGGGSSGGSMPDFSGGGGSSGGSSDFSNNSAMQSMMQDAMNQMMNTEKITLSESDVEDLELFVPGLSAASISATTDGSVSGGILDDATDYTVAGVTSDYATVSNLDIGLGDFITDEDNENATKVCVLGYNIATEIFGSAIDAYDSTIYIEDTPFVVNGVLMEMGSVASGISPDETIFIPLSSSEKYVMGNDYSPTITVIAEDVSDIDTTITNIEAVLAETYPNASFTITDAGAEREAATESANTLSFLLLAVASIVFVVGGIGIMNVLFVSVKERTQEIGILKAIGSSKRDILLEFLLEANMISIFGGILGIILSNLLMPIMEALGQTVVASAEGVVIAFLFAIATGTLFGFYPAYKAASLVPIDALNEQ
jgi:putative ABC transport system permease protein